MKLILRNASAVVTCSASGRKYKRGAEMKDVGMISGVDILVDDGDIAAIGNIPSVEGAEEFDVSEKILLPGFIDPHTHLIFAGTREREFGMRSRGATYAEIAGSGGGILETVSKTRETPKSRLRSLAERRLDRMLQWGSTTVEMKSGYGLDFKNELKMLETANEMKAESIADVVVTFLGAHAVPPEFKPDRDGYLRILVEELIPYVSRRKLADFCDVFCDEGFFTVEESSRILRAARSSGLKLKLHADEMSGDGGVRLGVDLGATSVDHLENISPDEIGALGRSETVGVVMPAVAAYLGMKPAPVREMIESDCVIALASDFNPGTSMVDNMQTVMWLAICLNRMTVEEALNAATINAAAALSLSDRYGSIEVGKKADMLIVDARDYSYLPYHFTQNRIERVIKNGTVLEFTR